MIQVLQSGHFTEWMLKLRDDTARARILTRVRRLREGNPGASRSLGGGIIELKIDYGPGYRVYFMPRGETLVVLLCGGNKSSQQQDIQRAREMAKQY